MSAMSTITFRIDKTTKRKLEDTCRSLGFKNVSELMRIVLVDLLIRYSQERTTHEPCLPGHHLASSEESCPVFRMFALLRCSRCVLSREAAAARKRKIIKVESSVESEHASPRDSGPLQYGREPDAYRGMHFRDL